MYRRVVDSDDDRPIEVTIMVKAGHLYELRYDFGAGTCRDSGTPVEEDGRAVAARGDHGGTSDERFVL